MVFLQVLHFLALLALVLLSQVLHSTPHDILDTVLLVGLLIPATGVATGVCIFVPGHYFIKPVILTIGYSVIYVFWALNFLITLGITESGLLRIIV